MLNHQCKQICRLINKLVRHIMLAMVQLVTLPCIVLSGQPVVVTALQHLLFEGLKLQYVQNRMTK